MVRSLCDRLRARCRLAVSETGNPESLREAEISVAAVGLGTTVVSARLQAARELAVRLCPSEISDWEIEWVELDR